jgi:hypothetical protein
MELRERSHIAQSHLRTSRIDHARVESTITAAIERLIGLQCARDDIKAARAALEAERWHNDASKLAANIRVIHPPFRWNRDLC